jgi:flagellar capping protein FliD
MFRKVLTASIIGFMLTSTLVATSASAATTISNGVLCPKAKINKTTKFGGAVYKCTKNPIVNKTKYTWVSKDCLNTQASYVKENASYLVLAKAMPATLAALDVKIAAAKVDAVAALAKADALDALTQTWNGKLAQFIAAKNVYLADKANLAKNAKSIDAYTAAIRSLNSAIRSNTAASAGYRKVGKTVSLMQATRSSTVTSLAQTKTGVAQTLSMRNLICAKGL